MKQPEGPKYDYDLQVWVVDGKVQPCSHPASMSSGGFHCCNGHRWAGMPHAEARKAASQATVNAEASAEWNRISRKLCLGHE